MTRAFARTWACFAFAGLCAFFTVVAGSAGLWSDALVGAVATGLYFALGAEARR